jgi:hypothetical protein
MQRYVLIPRKGVGLDVYFSELSSKQIDTVIKTVMKCMHSIIIHAHLHVKSHLFCPNLIKLGEYWQILVKIHM